MIDPNPECEGEIGEGALDVDEDVPSRLPNGEADPVKEANPEAENAEVEVCSQGASCGSSFAPAEPLNGEIVDVLPKTLEDGSYESVSMNLY